MRITLFTIFLLICLNLSQAQTPLDGTKVKQLIDSIQSQAPPNTNPPPAPGPQYYPGAGAALTPTPAPSATPAATPTPTPSAGTVSAATAPTSTTGSGSPTNAPIDQSGLLNPVTATSGKYEEYQSICRNHDYDNIKFQSAEIKNAKIAELKEAGGAGEGIHDQLPLLHEYLRQGDIKNFRALATRLKNTKSEPQDNDMLNALIAFSERNYRSATTALMKTLGADEKNEDVMKLLAEIYTAAANYYEAGTIYEDLNKLHKNAYLEEQCEAFISNSLNADGEKICLDAARKFPDNPFPYVYVGISHRERENLSAAISFFKKSMKVRPTEMGATCLAEAYFIQKKFTESADAFKQSLEASPNSIRAVVGLAWAQLKAKDYTASLAAFKRACDLNTRYQSEIRKAFKFLNDEKIIEAKKFLQLAESCGT